MRIRYKCVGSLLIVVTNEVIKTVTSFTEEDILLLARVSVLDNIPIEDVNKVIDLISREDVETSRKNNEVLNNHIITELNNRQYSSSISDTIATAEAVTKDIDCLDYDTVTGLVYLKGYNTPIHGSIVKAIKDSISCENKYTTDSLLNFTKWLMLNPNPEVREDLFLWLSEAELAITEEGNIIGYRNVVSKNKGSSERESAIVQAYVKRKAQKKGTKSVYMTEDLILCSKTDDKFPSLEEEYLNLDNSNKEEFTDAHTGKFKIRFNEVVSMPREYCSSDRDDSCSTGLHMRTAKSDHGCGDTTIICLINPCNITAIPHYDHTKFRCCEYLPIGRALRSETGEVIELEKGTYEYAYTAPIQLDFYKLLEMGDINTGITRQEFVKITSNVNILEVARNNKKRIEDEKRNS